MCGIQSHSSPAASISAGPLCGAMLMYSALLRAALHSLPLIGPHSLTLLSSSHLSLGCILPQRPGCFVWRETVRGDEKAFWGHGILYFTSSIQYRILASFTFLYFFTVADLFKLFFAKTQLPGVSANEADTVNSWVDLALLRVPTKFHQTVEYQFKWCEDLIPLSLKQFVQQPPGLRASILKKFNCYRFWRLIFDSWCYIIVHTERVKCWKSNWVRGLVSVPYVFSCQWTPNSSEHWTKIAVSSKT